MLNDNDSSWTALRMQEAVDSIESAWTSPSVLYKPKIFKDGDKWCALYGDNMMEGVVAFGSSPSEAAVMFNKEWYGMVN
uniref:Uncharacterized protein n=1 Tax=viral metagenome TaxID=1070528 RepID=A0A6M3K045_9ZZZZ